MIARISDLFGIVTLLVSTTGQADIWYCMTDSDCERGYVCMQGACVRSDDPPSDPPPAPEPRECRSHQDCEPHGFCEDGVCIEPRL
jgi:hypothetical protein